MKTGVRAFALTPVVPDPGSRDGAPALVYRALAPSMLPVLHALATLVVAPYAVLAFGFLLAGRAITSGSIWQALDLLLTAFIWLVPWGAIGFVLATLAIAGLGFADSCRRIAAAILAVVAIATLMVLVLMPTQWPGAGELLFLAPCFGAVAVAAAGLFRTPGALP